ncbi:response regulator [candidate division KSB1 bacterium]|nr:response regulator [candidate division KSB1 bacterium]
MTHNKNFDGTFKILLVEDNLDHSKLMTVMLKKNLPEAQIKIARSGAECLKLVKIESFSIIILDYELPNMSGLDTLIQMNNLNVQAPVVFVTGKGDELIAVNAMKHGAYDYIIKDKGYMYILPKVIQKAIEKHELELKLSESERKFQSLFDSISDFISVQNNDLKILLANKVASKLSGCSPAELIHQKCYAKYFDRDAPCKNCPVLETFKTGKPAFAEISHNNEIYQIRSQPIFNRKNELRNVVEIGQVVTEQRKLVNQLIRSEKLATIGLLSAGIAHELRNPLNIIETARYFISDLYGEENPELREKLDIIKKNVSRASAIINDLVELSHKSSNSKRMIDINKIIDKILSLIGKQLISKNINVIRDYKEIPQISFNSESLNQVLLNIIVNAIQAMPTGGELIIRTELNDHSDVQIKVIDSGCGISADDMNHIFDPFFTTKEVGDGAGLGLYIAHSIMTREGAKIDVESEKGFGSTFILTLPINNQKTVEK